TQNQKQIARRSTWEAMNAIQNGEAGYVRMSFLIHMEADTHQELEELDFRVFSVLNGASIESRITREEAWEGFLTSLPLGRNYVSASTEFGLLTPPLAGLFFFTTPNLQHEGPDAVLYGLDLSADGQPVIVDDWQMPRPGSLTLGPPDTGKTYLTKSDSTRKRAVGHRINILDPAANSYYDAVAEKIGGVHAALAVGSPNKINPFDLHDNYMALHMLTDAIADSVGEEEAERRARTYAIDGKVTALEPVVRLMVGRGRGLTEDEEPTVQSALYRCYELAGITSDPDTHSRPKPTFSGDNECDFFNVLRTMKDEAEKNGDEDEAGIIKGLLRKLGPWDSGTLCELFDQQTTVDVYSKYLVIQVASIDEKAKPAVMAGVMECINGVLSNPDERAHLYVDEAHNLLYDDDSAAHLEKWTRTGRVRNTSVHLISQNTEEFTDTHQGKIIRDNVGTVFVFQQGNREAAERLASIYGLSERETDDIHTRLRKGQCYLIAGPSRHKIQVLASEEEDHFFDTSPGAASRRK
ncbi:MAG: type IV secretory system conjugative DNA transfer family protein, partial [Rubrobacter sp.]|nr:type IV secretory system conjugative DNA transfer family protein [Rubrobacter sp.]